MLPAAALLWGAWLLFSGGEGATHGALVALLAAAVMARFAGSPWPFPRPLAIPGFVLAFVWRSFFGAIDVAWRALHRDLPLQPHWLEYHLHLTQPAARALFLGAISLMPGTLGADLKGDVVRVHGILDGLEDDLHLMERQIAAVFNEPGVGR